MDNVESDKKTGDDEIKFDFSKIKNIFKKKEKNSEQTEKSEDEISFGDMKTGAVDAYKKSLPFFKKYGVVLLILIPLFLGVYIRIQALDLHVLDKYAAESVDNINKNLIAQSVKSQFPLLPEANQQKMVEDEYQKMKDSGKVYVPQGDQLGQASYNDAVKMFADSYKARLKNDNGDTYLSDIDTYYYARFARNLVELGRTWDVLKDGKPWNNHRVAPYGSAPEMNWHSYSNYVVYRISEFFGNKELMNAVAYVPVIFAALSVIPCFFLIRRIAGNIGATIGSTMLAVNSAFLTRTVAGSSDTDVYNVFFPVLISWLFIEAFETRSTKKKILLSLVSGLFVGIYSRFWSGWWYVFDFILATVAIYALYEFAVETKIWKSAGFFARLKEKKLILIEKFKDIFYTTIPFFITSMLSVIILFPDTLYHGWVQFFNAFIGFPLSVVTLKEVALGTIWPNVLTTVAELNPSSVEQTIGMIGGSFLFLLGCLGIIATLMKKNHEGKVDVKYVIFLTLWFIGTIYGSTKGVRFTLLLVPAFSIAFGCLFGIIGDFISKKVPGSLQINKIFVYLIIIALACVVFINPVKAGYSRAANDLPMMNDAWWDALTHIKQTSQPNAIITSWWDYGHWFQYVADRPVTFDGASQNLPQAHWIGRMLQTSNEEEAVSILRMVDCGAHHSYYILKNETNDELTTVKMLKQIILMNETDARDYLQENNITEKTINALLEKTHCTPPEAFVIASDDMIGKAGVWGHFGSWNFDKAEMVRDVRGKSESEGTAILMDKFKLDKEKAQKTYDEIVSNDPNQWIATWPGYFSGMSGCTNINNETFQCIGSISGNRIPLLFNTTSKEAYAVSQDGKRINFRKVVYLDRNGTVEKNYDDEGLETGVLIAPDGNGYNAMFADPLLINSMFTRMFFTYGHGLKCFDLVDEQTQLTGGKIYVYKVNWECSSDNNVYFKETLNTTAVPKGNNEP